MAISAAYPFESHYADVDGARIHYIEQGTGDPILFLHGNPTSSYLWRNVIPVVSPQGRCIAMDLVGFGKSDKPDITYDLLDHRKYVEGFINALGLKNLTLVVHDWGGAFGFDYVVRHRNNVRAIAFMETFVSPFNWDTFLEGARDTFRAFRTPDVGWKMICEQNIFVEQLLPSLVQRKLLQEEMDFYRSPFPTVESRKAVWKFPNILPFDDRQDDTYREIKKIEEGLPSLNMPMLLLWVQPGAIIREEQVKWFQQRLPALDVVNVGSGLHFIQEDCPEAIGQAIVRWMEKRS